MSPRLASRAIGLCTSLTVLLVITGARPAAAQCGGTQLCAPGAGDCTVAADCTITLPPAGLLIDLGARRLVISKNLRVVGPAGVGLTVSVGNLLFNGGSIVALGDGLIGGGVTIVSASDITVQNGPLIDVSAGIAAGIVDLTALNGSIDFAGRIKANGTTRASFGGDVTLFALESANVSGSMIDVSGGDQGAGGSIAFDALNGSIIANVPLNAAGADGGDIEMAAGTTLQTSSNTTMKLGATGDAGSGGSVDLSAVNDLTMGGEVTGSGSTAMSSDDGASGGDGADVDVYSEAGNVAMNGRVEVNGASGGLGGAIDIEAGLNLTFSKALIAQGSGIDGAGGDVFLVAGGTMTLPQQIDVRGGTGGGGSIGAISLGDLTVSTSLLTDGSGFGGQVFLSGCTVNITSQALVSAQGPGGASAGSTTVQASSAMTVRGTLRATTQNQLQHRAAPAPSLTGAVITPAATIQLDPSLPCCVSCPVTTTTTTTTSTSTTVIATTSTTVIATTSTSTTSPTTTSSTTTTTVPSICGNGVVTGAEQCDDNNTVGGDCCSATCTFEAANAPCANEGNACTRDVCNGAGVCTHPAGNAGATCRAAAGDCDQAETCSGTSATCPADVKGTGVCRPSAGTCDVAESCNGVSNACPADAFASATTPCRAAAGACDVAETCTGSSSTCPADGSLPDGTGCGGGDVCTTSGTCQSGVCSGGDPVSCAACETCDPVEGCVAAPRPSCRRPVEPGKAPLKLKDSAKGPDGDQLTWKWDKGAATALADFGDPTGTDGLALCVFDRSQATASLLFRAAIAPGGDCGTATKPKPCWTSNGKNFKFKSKAGNADGITSLVLTPGAAGKAKTQLKGKGTGLTGRPFGLPAPPLPLPLTVQLQSENGQCWEASYSAAGVKKNIDEKFDAKAD